MKSKSMQNYLKAIYLIQEEQNGATVTTSELAARLGVANASVTGMLKRLASFDPQLVTYAPYSGVRLSPAGEQAALELIRHHRLLESYLNQMLGYSWDEIHAEAERLEHVISEELEERIAAALGHPTIDPHGDPIPDRAGRLRLPGYLPLTNLPDNSPAAIQRVIDQSPELLRYLAGLGLVLFTRVRVISKAPFNGPISIIAGDQTATVIALNREVTDKILVTPISSTMTANKHE